MNKIKITIFHPALAPYRIDFFNKLSTKYETNFYFSYNNLNDQKFNQSELQKEILFKFNLLDNGFNFKNTPFRFGINKIIKKNNPNIVICSEYSQITLYVIFLKYFFYRKIKIYTMSDDSVDLSNNIKGIRYWIRKIVSYLIDGIIFPSENVCNWYTQNINYKTKTLVLPIIHDNNVFRKKLLESIPKSNYYINKYNLIDKKIFLFIGRLVKIKNIDFLLKSFANCNTSNEILIIIGDGEESDNLKLLVNKLKLDNKCIFTGRLEGQDLITWYNIAQCFILPSYLERFGAVVNEALIAGCKVLCSDLAGASELIIDHNGCKFNPYKEKQLTELIEKMSNIIEPTHLPIKLKSDLMPYTLNDKLDVLFSQI